MAALGEQFKSYRSWWRTLGLSYQMTKLGNGGRLSMYPANNCCDGWERVFSIPQLGHMIQYTRDAQASYVNGLQNEVIEFGAGQTSKRWAYTDIEGVQWEQLQYFYADIITDREDLWQEVIDAIEAGTTPRTPLELEALALAEEWKQMIIMGGASRQEAEMAAGLSGSSSPVLSLPSNLTPKLTLPTRSGALLGSILPMKKYPLLQTVAITAGAVYLINKVVL